MVRTPSAPNTPLPPPPAADHPDLPGWQLLLQLPSAVLVTRAQRIVLANPAAQRLFGQPEAALLGRSPLTLFQPEALPAARARIRALQPGEATDTPIALTVLRPDGASRPVDVTARLLAEPDAGTVLLVLHDVTALRQERAELLRSQAALRQLAAAQHQGLDEARQAWARALHDELQQTLAVIRIELATANDRLASDPATTQARLARVSALALAALAATRRIVNDLRPPVLDDLGLAPALEWLVGQVGRSEQVACSLHLPADATAEDAAAPCSAAAAVALYQVAQAALDHATRQPGTRQVAVALSRGVAGSWVLAVSGDGEGAGGLPPADRPTPWLLALQERLRPLGGVLHWARPAGGGLRLEATVPVDGQRLPPEPAPAEAAAETNAYALLLQFLYRAPVGLLQCAADGTIEMLNPPAARWLLPYSPDGSLDNLFTVLAGALPRLRDAVAAFEPANGTVCDGLALPPAAPRWAPAHLQLSLLQHDGGRLMVLLRDDTAPPPPAG